jgi:hypothetical protein
MKKRFLQFGLLGVMFAAVIVGFATRKPAKKATPAIYSFDYYPKANVYYNKTNHSYAFLSEDGSWQVAEHLPSAIPLEQDKKVALTNASPDIWKDNERHRMVYAAALYASASDLKAPAVTPPPPPVITNETAEKKDKAEPKKERGIKGFFKKIFKKKRDKDSTSSH